MRFYEITIKQKDGTVWVPPSMKALGRTDVSYSSLVNNKPNPAALDVYIDLPLYYLSAPRQGAHVTLNGISLEDIARSTHLVEGSISVRGGMLDGYLPLSKHFKPDVLVEGTLYYTAGNWEGTNTSLDLYVVSAAVLNPAIKGSVTFNWLVGQKLSEALRELFSATYGKSATNPKGLDIKIAISDDLQPKTPFPGNYANLGAFATELKRFTKEQFPHLKRVDGGSYDGVEVFVANGTIYAVDGTKPGDQTSKHPFDSPLAIRFQDMIGQPTWKSFNSMVFKTIMRGDISLSDYVSLPAFLNSPYIITQGNAQQAPNTSEGMGLPSKNKVGFPGTFYVQEVRHVGQFRGPSGLSWVTVVDCFVPGKELAPVVTPKPPDDSNQGAPPPLPDRFNPAT